MNRLRRAFASCFLASLAVPAARAEEVPNLRLSADPTTQTLQIQTYQDGHVFLSMGPLAGTPIPLHGIFLDVVPENIVPLGFLRNGDVVRLFVPRALSHLHVEGVAISLDPLGLHDSNVVSLTEAFRDLIEATFRAELVSTDSIPPFYSVAVSATAPTSGYELLVDGVRNVDQETNVYMRLIEPGPGEMVMPVLEPLARAADLGTEVGEVVVVHLLRVPRGTTVPEVYRVMVRLPGVVKN